MSNKQNDIYENETFEKEEDKKKKKGFFSIFINILLGLAIIALIALMGNNIYQYMNIRSDGIRTEDEAVAAYDPLICDESTGTVSSSYIPGGLSDYEPEANSVIGYIDIPAVDMTRGITVGDASDGHNQALLDGVAWDPYTSLPQTGGYTVIAGHRDYMFQPLKDVEVGDGIIVNINDQIFTYEVTTTKVIAEDANEEVFLEDDSETLVLYTCYPFYYWAPITERYVVYATPVDSIEYDECEQTEDATVSEEE